MIRSMTFLAADLLHLERAAAANKWHTVRELVNFIETACLQICERNATNAAATLGWIPVGAVRTRPPLKCPPCGESELPRLA